MCRVGIYLFLDALIEASNTDRVIFSDKGDFRMKLRYRAYLGFAVVCAMAVSVLAPVASAEDGEERVGDAYTLNTCPVSGEILGGMGDPIIMVLDGREVRFCCAGCPGRFTSSPDSYWGAVDERMIADQMKRYPLDTDVVSGKPLASSAIDVIVNNRLVRFADKDSRATFDKDPATYLAKLDEAVITSQLESYPFEVCAVSREKIGAGRDDAINVIMANQLFRMCCESCATALDAAPAAYIAAAQAGNLASIAKGEGSDHK